MSGNKLTTFKVQDKSVPVSFVETQTVKKGVECDIYTFVEDSSRDLAIVTVSKGYKTPLQRVLLGKMTIEGFYEGVGTLTVRSKDGKTDNYSFKSPYEQNVREVAIELGQIMQWYADGDDDLVFYEICQPPYSDGRFENLEETG